MSRSCCSDAGLDAVHVRDKGLQHATDVVILEFARQHGFVLVSEDTDFGELLARQRTARPSFVLLRTYEPLTPDEQAGVLLANLPRLRAQLVGWFHLVCRDGLAQRRTGGPPSEDYGHPSSRRPASEEGQGQ